MIRGSSRRHDGITYLSKRRIKVEKAASQNDLVGVSCDGVIMKNRSTRGLKPLASTFDPRCIRAHWLHVHPPTCLHAPARRQGSFGPKAADRQEKEATSMRPPGLGEQMLPDPGNRLCLLR